MIEEYEKQMQVYRDEFKKSLISNLDKVRGDSKLVGLFLLYFSRVGTQMTGPVEGWLLGAAERCEELGYPKLGKALRGHASAEAGHNLMMVADEESLSKVLNIKINEDILAKNPTPSGVAEYIGLHEEVIKSDTPWRQIALQYEIEILPVEFGPMVMKLCSDTLGEDILKSMSFIVEHVTIDVGHTKFNLAQLKSVLELHSSLEPCVDVGRKALEAYGHFINDCLELALETKQVG